MSDRVVIYFTLLRRMPFFYGNDCMVPIYKSLFPHVAKTILFRVDLIHDVQTGD